MINVHMKGHRYKTVAHRKRRTAFQSGQRVFFSSSHSVCETTEQKTKWSHRNEKLFTLIKKNDSAENKKRRENCKKAIRRRKPDYIESRWCANRVLFPSFPSSNLALWFSFKFQNRKKSFPHMRTTQAKIMHEYITLLFNPPKNISLDVSWDVPSKI